MSNIMREYVDLLIRHIDNPDWPIQTEAYYIGDDGERAEVIENHSPYWLAMALWEYPEILPGDYCLDLGLPLGSTIAQTVRYMYPETLWYWRRQDE